MIGTILRGYSAVLGSAIRFAALIGVCVGTGFLLVYPLWTLAVSRPDLYTLVFTTVLSAGIVLFFVLRARTSFKAGARSFLFGLARKAVLFSGVLAFVLLVLHYERTLAFISLLLTILLYGFIAFVLSPEKHSPDGR